MRFILFILFFAYAVCNKYFILYYATLLAHDLTMLHSVIENTCFFWYWFHTFHSQKWYKTDIIYFQFIHRYWDPVGHIALWYTVWCPHGCILCNCSRSSKYSMPRENLHTVKRPQRWSINIPSVSLFPLLPPPRTVAHYYCTVLTALHSDFKSRW